MNKTNRWQSWGDVFRHYAYVKNYDQGYAAHMADEWEKRHSRVTAEGETKKQAEETTIGEEQQ